MKLAGKRNISMSLNLQSWLYFNFISIHELSSRAKVLYWGRIFSIIHSLWRLPSTFCCLCADCMQVWFAFGSLKNIMNTRALFFLFQSSKVSERKCELDACALKYLNCCILIQKLNFKMLFWIPNNSVLNSPAQWYTTSFVPFFR